MFGIGKWLGRMSLAKLESWYNHADQGKRFDVEAACAAGAEKLARYSAYISRRMSGGTHQDAVKRQNQVAGRVRKALGYTYKSEVNF